MIHHAPPPTYPLTLNGTDPEAAPERPQARLPMPPDRVTSPHSVFMGPFGLRAGWGMLIFLALFLLLAASASVGALAVTGKLRPAVAYMLKVHVAKRDHLPPPPPPPADHVRSGVMSPRAAMLNESLQAVVVLSCAALLALIERRRLREYFLGRPHLGDLLPGALTGLIALGSLVGVLRLLHLIRFDGLLLGAGAALRWGTVWLVIFALVGFGEEYAFRGYLLSALTRGLMVLAPGTDLERAHALAFGIASLAMSGLFFFAHTGNHGENAFGLLVVFVAGAAFCYALWRTGSLWWGIGFHMTWDWSQSFLYGTADSGQVSAHRLMQSTPLGRPELSGGSAGPEGSVFAVVALLCVTVGLHLAYRGRRLPLPQPARGLPDPYPAADAVHARTLIL